MCSARHVVLVDIQDRTGGGKEVQRVPVQVAVEYQLQQWPDRVFHFGEPRQTATGVRPVPVVAASPELAERHDSSTPQGTVPAVMRAQRPAGSAPCVAAAAESLPFEDRSFDVAMAVSTVHHGGDPMAGLREMRRVARRVVVLTFDTDEPGWQDRFWLTRDYLPEFAAVLAEFPPLAGMAGAIGARAEPVPVPWDCADGLFEAYWRRPEAYLEDHVRRAVSVWTRVGPEAEQRAVRSLGDDLVSGRWAERNSRLAGLDAADLGLRLLVA